MSIIRGLIVAIVAILTIYFSATVPLGSRTLLGHAINIMQSTETRELVDGVKESSGPMVDRIKRGVKAGIEEAQRDVPHEDSGDTERRLDDADEEELATRDPHSAAGNE